MRNMPRLSVLVACCSLALFGVSLGTGCEEQPPETPEQPQQPPQPQQPSNDQGNGEGDDEEGEDDTEPIMPLPQQQ